MISLLWHFASGGDAEGDQLNKIENLSGSVYDDVLWGHNGVNCTFGQSMLSTSGKPDIGSDIVARPIFDPLGHSRRKACSVLAPPNWGIGRTGNSLRPFRTIQVRL